MSRATLHELACSVVVMPERVRSGEPYTARCPELCEGARSMAFKPCERYACRNEYVSTKCAATIFLGFSGSTILLTMPRFPTNPSLVAALILATAALFTFELAFWTSHPYADDILWSRAAIDFAKSIPPTAHDEMSVHPGTTILVPAGLMIRTGVSPDRALDATLALLTSLGVLGVSFLCWKLRPHTHWWLATGLLLSFNVLYFSLTAPSVIAMFLVIALFLLLLHMHENEKVTTSSIAVLALIAGLLLATRLDTGILVLSMSAVYLLFTSPRLLFAAPFALLLLVAFDPYLWSEPVAHITKIVDLVKSNSGTRSPEWAIVSAIPVLAAFVFCAWSMLFGKKEHTSKDFLMFLFLVSCFSTVLFTLSSYHPFRYYYVIFAFWEVLAALFIGDMLRQSRYFSSDAAQTIALVALVLCFRLLPFLVPGSIEHSVLY